MKKNIVLGLFAFIIFLGCSFYITYPLILHMTTYVTGELVVAWIMNWNIHALTQGIFALSGSRQAFFDTNIFYPYHNTLAYSDLLLSSSILAWPFFVLIHEPELPSNITFISSIIFLGFFTYILVFYLTKNFFTSLISGLLVIFSPVTLDKRYHLQILAIEWIPLALVFFLHFFKSRQYKFLIFSLLCFLIQTYNSFMAGYFLLFSYIGIITSYFLFDKKSLYCLLTKKTYMLFILSFLLILPITIPYFQVSHEFNFVRDIRETIHLALQPEDLLVTSGDSRLKPLLWFFDAGQYPPTAEIKPGFLGLVFSILSILSIAYIVRVIKRYTHGKNWREKAKKNIFLFSFSTVGIFGLILSLGPALHIGRLTIHHPFLIPLPYALLYYTLPGFQGIRDSSRFEMLFVISMAVVIGIVLHELLKKKSKLIIYSIFVVLSIGIIGEFRGTIAYGSAYTFENFPPIYSWINTHLPKNAILLEIPVYNWDNNPFGDNREVLREYFSTLHFRELISGGSGFSPPPWQDFAKMEFTQFPSQKSIAAIKKYGAEYIIVHADEFDILHKNNYEAGNHVVYPSSYILSHLSQNNELTFIIKEGNAYVYVFK